MKMAYVMFMAVPHLAKLAHNLEIFLGPEVSQCMRHVKVELTSDGSHGGVSLLCPLSLSVPG